MENIAAKIEVELLIKVPNQKIHFLSTGAVGLDFIFEDETAQGHAIFTPFTSEGLLTETGCFGCAVESLVRRRRGPDVFIPCDRRAQPFSIVISLLAGRPFGHTTH